MENIFIISSPFQILSAIEANNNHSKGESLFVFFLGKNELQNSFILKIVDKFIEGQVVHVDYSDEVGFLTAKIKLLKSLKKKKFNNVFVGDYQEFSMQLFACNLNYDKLYVLDDGTSTLVLNNQLIDSITHIRCNNDKITGRNIIKWLLVVSYGLKLKRKVQVNWFTMFEFNPMNKANIIKHQFEYMRSARVEVNSADASASSKRVYFIGSNLVNAGVVKSKENYLDLLTKIRSHYATYEFIYLPHRLEDKNVLKELVSNCNIELLQLDNIIELAFIENSIVPAHICSFYSTALYSLKLIYPLCNIDLVTLEKELLNETYIEMVEDIEIYYKQFFKTILLN